MAKCDVYQCSEEAAVRIENIYDKHFFLRCREHYEKSRMRYERLQQEGRIKIVFLKGEK